MNNTSKWSIKYWVRKIFPKPNWKPKYEWKESWNISKRLEIQQDNSSEHHFTIEADYKVSYDYVASIDNDITPISHTGLELIFVWFLAIFPLLDSPSFLILLNSILGLVQLMKNLMFISIGYKIISNIDVVENFWAISCGKNKR